MCDHEMKEEWNEVIMPDPDGTCVRVYIQYCTKCGHVESVWTE